VSYRAWRMSLVPTTHQRPTGQAFQGALGDVEDALIDRAKQAVKARFPLLAPPDALTALGVERQLPQGPGESTAAYAARLQGAWLLWPWAGTPYGLLRAFWDAGYHERRSWRSRVARGSSRSTCGRRARDQFGRRLRRSILVKVRRFSSPRRSRPHGLASCPPSRPPTRRTSSTRSAAGNRDTQRGTGSSSRRAASCGASPSRKSGAPRPGRGAVPKRSGFLRERGDCRPRRRGEPPPANGAKTIALTA
jgi:hypothetical protein